MILVLIVAILCVVVVVQGRKISALNRETCEAIRILGVFLDERLTRVEGEIESMHAHPVTAFQAQQFRRWLDRRDERRGERRAPKLSAEEAQAFSDQEMAKEETNP